MTEINTNYLLNAIASDDKDVARQSFDSLIQDRLVDALEVRKVELASGILDGSEQVVEDSRPPHKTHQVVYSVPGEGKGKQFFHVTADDVAHAKEQLMDAQPTAKIHKVERIVHEGAGMDAQRRMIRQVSGILKANPDGSPKAMHRQDLKQRARKMFQKYQPHGVEFVDRAANTVRNVRNDLKRKEKLSKFGEETIVEGGPTRKHFQQTADLIKQIEHPDKRKEMANHHASLFAQQNPRFDRSKFMSAAGVNEAAPAAQAGASARNVITNIRRGITALKVKGVNPMMASRAHADFSKLVAKNPKAPGYMLLRKLAPNKAAAMQALTQSGMPVGGALGANPTEYNQALQRVKRFK